MKVSAASTTSLLSGPITDLPSTKPAAPETVAEAASASKTAEKEFLDFAKMSVGERIRKQFLDAKGLTEDSLKSMDPKDRQKIEDEIREAIKKAIRRGTGVETGNSDTTVPPGTIANLVA